MFVGVIKVMMAAEACGFAEIDFRFALSITETPLEGSFSFFFFFFPSPAIVLDDYT